MSQNIQEQILGDDFSPQISQQQTQDQGGVGGRLGAQTQYSTNAPTGAPDILQIMNRTTAATAMSNEGNLYVKQLKEVIQTKNTMQEKIDVVSLSFPSEALGIVCGKFAYILIFDEAMRTEENLPVIAHNRTAVETLRALYADVVVRNTIVVTRADYEKVEAMAVYLINAFACFYSPEIRNITVKSLENYIIEISTNAKAFQDFNRRYNPHGVEARDDLKFVLTLTNSRSVVKQTNLFDKTDSNKLEFATVAAYVRITEIRTAAGARFVPEVHISEICSMLLYDGLITAIVATASSALIDHQYWKTQFNYISNDAPNIGNVIMDQSTGAPFRCENLPQKEEIINAWFEKPVMMLDYVAGRACVPGLEQYAITESNTHIVSAFNKFLDAEVIMANAVITTPTAIEYVGTGMVGNKEVDSRWFDFLNTMIHNNFTRAQCAQLLARYSDPDLNYNIVKQFSPDLRLLYVNHSVILHPEVYRPVQQAIKSVFDNSNNGQTTGMVDMTMLTQFGNQWAQNVQTGYMQAQTTPFTQIYGPQQGHLFQS